jgi:FKBP-type peptidyl-prolyl cis-trans isomerase 2
LDTAFVPGDLVRHPGRLDWGIGQVQSADGDRITVDFEHAGKHLINIGVIALTRIEPDSNQ